MLERPTTTACQGTAGAAVVGTPKQCRDQMQKYFDTGVHEIRLVFNEPNKDAYLKALRAVAPRG